jgi:hypothetical protein
MTQYLLAKARCSTTAQTVKSQDLSGRRLQLHERRECQLIADRLAEQLTTRSGVQWVGYCEIFTPAKTRF